MNTELRSALSCCSADNAASCIACPYFISDPCRIALAYNLLGFLSAYHSAEAVRLIATLRGYLDCYEGLSSASLSEDDLPDLFRRIFDYLKEKGVA